MEERIGFSQAGIIFVYAGIDFLWAKRVKIHVNTGIFHAHKQRLSSCQGSLIYVSPQIGSEAVAPCGLRVVGAIISPKDLHCFASMPGQVAPVISGPCHRGARPRLLRMGWAKIFQPRSYPLPTQCPTAFTPFFISTT